MHRLSRILLVIVAALALAAIVGEAVARFGLGLGTPLLYAEHPRIEYLLKPNQDLLRFGNRVTINEHGMRSPPLSPQKDAPDELRILVFGDSIVNGGAHIDQGEVATSRLQQALAPLVAPRPLHVANVSAGSWGPGNWLAFAEERGTFDADVIVLVVSSHDASDNPTFAPLEPDVCPTRTPPGALWEAVERYLPRYLRSLAQVGSPGLPPSPPEEAETARALGDLRAFLELAKRRAKEVLVVQFAERAEAASGEPLPGHLRIRELCTELGVRTVDAAPRLRQELDGGATLYLDWEHPNAEGHRILGEVILRALQASPVVGAR